MATPESPGLSVRTTEIDDDDPLLDLLPADQAVTWLRRDEGLVGWGVAAEIRPRGITRFSDADKWWTETVARADIRDDVNEPGTGLVCFGSFAFADDPGDSVLTVPRVVVGRRSGRTWLTLVDDASYAGRSEVADAPEDVVFSDGAMDGEHWMAVVAEAVRRITAGALGKVVLARDLVATAASRIDVRWPLRRLVTSYPMCWTFHVDGLFGATPEMLVRRERGLVTSRVLAGTIRRTGDDERDLALAAALARSTKDHAEHEYAVRSVADALEPHCSSMTVPETPFVLHLPNVMHLASDIAGVVHDATTVSSLQLAASLHPSAAVGGTPTTAAVALISEIEGMERGRYAGPVGWMDTSGDGEWGIALRSAEIAGNTVRLFAGCGIVADSDPEAELAETQAKFVPVRDSLAAG
ncbi:MAG TPA: isochorismate synthase [Nocardioides sp.]|jgi:menaquinone-specific isochorismate synthase|uniref:isochorismate synthase n=1 Tax=Nocardioides sp. TaxID=35761 RepID=UPI002E301B43|nr:isochorismate synthase [Nocardioides sp.]HEX3933004.1 isochorismate synthase [Nocardioides sp.]